MKPTRDGRKLWKRLYIKVIVQGKVQPHNFCAPAQRGYTEQDIDDTRARAVEYLDQRFPYFDFREVRLAPNAFNYVATGVREKFKEGLHGRTEQATATIDAGGSSIESQLTESTAANPSAASSALDDRSKTANAIHGRDSMLDQGPRDLNVHGGPKLTDG